MNDQTTTKHKECEWTGCRREALETVSVELLGVFEDEHHLCVPHAEDVRNSPAGEVNIRD